MLSRAARMCRVASCSHLVRDDRPCPVHGARKPFEGAHGHAEDYRQSARLKPSVMQRDYGRVCPHCPGACVSPSDQVDHYPVALADGGETSMENLRRAHADCNVRAGGSLGRSRKRATA